jgi:hypothetical protein
MKHSALFLLSVLLAPPLFADSGERLIPAGSLISCTTAEPKLSSKTTAIGDPVLCHLGHSERYGRSVLPYNSYLVGRFEDYKDPGHFVGKGWMELKFDHMVIEPDTVVPVNARVVDVPGYKVDNQGRILGKGHAVRDAVLWSIPVLWPVDLIMLPMRGPRPTLKEETVLTLKVMDDLAVPQTEEPQRDPYGLIPRGGGEAYAPQPPAPVPDEQPAPNMSYAPQEQPEAPPAMAYAPPAEAPPMAYAPPMMAAPPPPMVGYGYAPPMMGYSAPMMNAPRMPGYAYRPRMSAPRPVAPRAYAYGSRPTAPRTGGYGYAGGRAAAPQGWQSRGPAMGARGESGMAYRGGGGGYRGR